MAESQGDVYVRKDVFEARMDRMEMLLEKTVLEIKSYVDKSTGETKVYVEKSLAETKAYVEKSVADTQAYVEKAVGEMKADIADVKNDVKFLTARVDALEQTLGARITAVENTLVWWIGIFAALIGLSAFVTPIASSIKKLFQPPITLEDMEQVAERVANAVIERHLSGGK